MSQGSQAVRSGMARRLPTRAELAARQGMVLTSRDRAILDAVALHGVVTTELIALAFFPPRAGARKSPCTCAYDRLRQLWLWSYLERLEPPLARSLGGRTPFLYALGRQAVPDLTARLGTGEPPVRRRRLDRLLPLFMDHDLKAAALWANIERLRTTKPPHLRALRAVRWAPEHVLRSQAVRVADPLTGRPIPCLPDGYFELTYADGVVQCCVLEVDMGTVSLGRFRRKLRAFEAFLAEGQFTERWRHKTFEVLVLTPSRRRLERLWQSAKQTVPSHRWNWYSFATFDVLRPDQFVKALWTTLDGEFYSLLYAPQAGDAGDASEAER